MSLAILTRIVRRIIFADRVLLNAHDAMRDAVNVHYSHTSVLNARDFLVIGRLQIQAHAAVYYFFNPTYSGSLRYSRVQEY